MSLSPPNFPKTAVQALTDLLISSGTADERIVELVIRLDDANLNVREFGVYLSLVDGIYGRLTEAGLKRYSQTRAEQLRIHEIRKGSIELVIARSVVQPEDATPLAVLWLCLRYLLTWIELSSETAKIRSEASHDSAYGYGGLYEDRLAKEHRGRLKAGLKQDKALEELDNRKVSRLAALLEELYAVERERLPASARFAQKSVQEVALLVRSPSALQNRYPLRGTPIHYDDPFAPVAHEDWDAAR